MSNIDDLSNHIYVISLFCDQSINKYKNFLNQFENESKELKDIRETYEHSEKEIFSFFEGIEKYKREDFNDIIISQILNPDTKEIGNIKYLHIFIELLCKINNNLNFNQKFNNNVTVERQKGRIDILISDNNNAIIIESKINGYWDRDDQLARYYHYVKNNLKKEVSAVVYIRPVYDEYRMPSFENYSDEYKDEIEKILVPISIVSSKNKLDFCHGFLDACCDQNNIDKASINIKQYSDLLKKLGGSKMAMNVSKEMFKKLYGDSNSVAITNDIGEIWEDRWNIFSSIIQEKLINELNFKPDGDKYCYKKINDKLTLAFFYDTEWKALRDNYIIGFWHEPIDKETKKKLMEYLNKFESSLLYEDKAEDNADEGLIYRKFEFDLVNPVGEILNDIMQIYKKVESEISSLNI